MKKSQEYKYIEHTGDMGIKVYGPTIQDLFQNACKAFFDMITDLNQIKPSLEKIMIVESNGWERLLVTWLNEFLYLFEVDGWLFQKCRIQSLSENNLEALCFGEKFDPERHEIKTQIKAVTYHQLSIQKINDLWETTIIVDI